MNVMHFSLGFPPYRSGGLVKYASDLAHLQAENGDNVFVIWPGRFTLSRKTQLKYVRIGKLTSIEIINGLPITLTYGVSNPEALMKDISDEIFSKMLENLDIDVFHIHTFMGLPLNLIKECNKRKIRVVFTTHDYFPFCSKTKMYFDNKICTNNERCSLCNSSAPSIIKLKINQSFLGNFIRKFSFLKSKFKPNVEKISLCDNGKNYEELKKYYLTYFQYIDIVHCNSSISYDVYKKYISNEKLKLLPISHVNLKKEKVIKNTSFELRIGYFGEETKEKGFFWLLNILDNFQRDFSLHVFGKDNYVHRSYLKYGGTYKYFELSEIYKNIDVVIVPSLWYETFGFVAVEALCHDVPVICSDKVGSKDFVNPQWIYSSKDELIKLLNKIAENKSCLNNYFEKRKDINEFQDHLMKIRSEIYE